MNRFAVMLGFALLSACAQPPEEDATPAPRKPTAADEAREAREREEGVQRRLQEMWLYQDVLVEGGTQKSAAIYSRVADVGEGNIEPEPDAQLILRDHPSWGRSAYLLLKQSKFDCGKPCKVTIAFDKGDPREFAANQADSGKGPALFINDETKFIEALKQAELVRINLPQGSGILSSVTFEVGGYDASKYH